MADNVTTREDTALSLGPIFATDQIGSTHYPLSKIGFGALDSFTIVTASAGLPVEQQTGSSWTVSNAGTFAVQESGGVLTALQLIDNVVRAEDDASAGGHNGNVVLVVRDDALIAGAGVSADGDYTFLRVNNEGALWTKISGTVTVDGSGVTQPVSGTVTANAGTNLNTSLLALETGGNLAVLASTVSGAEVQVDIVAVTPDLMLGTDFSSVFGTVSLVLATQADDVANTSDGLQATAFGYMFDGTAWDRMRGTSVDGLLVNLGANNDVTVTSGSITANAGTNLNTSALALEAGGNLATIAGAVAGAEMQVDVVAALPAGANNIGDVDVLSVIPGVGATNLGKAVDDASGATDTGVALLVVRDDALTTLTPIDGDYTQLRVNSTGALHVTGGGGGTEYTEDDAAPANPVAAALSLVRQDTPAGLTTADGDIVTARGTNFGAMFCQIIDSAGAFIDTFGGGVQYTEGAVDASITGTAIMLEGAADTLVAAPGTAADGMLVNLGTNNDVTVTGTVTANAGTNLNTSLLALETGGNLATLAGTVGGTELQVDIVAVTPDLMLGTDFSSVLGTSSLVLATQADDVANTSDGLQTTSFGYMFDGTTWDRVRGTSVDGLLVNLGANNDVTVTGSVTANAGTNLNTSLLALEGGGNLATVAGAVAGTEMQVDVVAALPAGTNNIGDVDVLSVIPGTGATNLGKAEDGPHTSGDVGVMSLAVRNDAGTTLAGLDGDYAPLSVNSAGALYVTGGGGGTEYVEDDAAPANPTAAALSLVRQDTPAGLTTLDGDIVTARGTNFGAMFCQVIDSAGNFIDTFGGSGGTAQADESSFTEGTTSMTPVGGVFNETIVSNPTEDQAAAVRITEFRAFHVNCRDLLGNQAIVPGTNSNHLGKLEDGVSTSGATGVLALVVRNDTPGTLVSTDGDYAAVQQNATGALYVDGSNSTQPVSGTVTANAGTDLNTSLLALEGGGNLATIAGAVAGTEMQVDVIASLPAGTNNIGDVDVLSVVPGTAATNLGKAIDSAAGATDTGVALLAIRDDALTTLTPIDGDYVPIRVNSTGELHVTGGGGGTEYNEDDATPATIVGAATLMERDDVLAAVTPIEGDWIAFRGTAEGALWTQDFNSDAILADTSTIAGAVSGTEMQVDVVAALPAGTNNIGDVDVLTFPATVHSEDFDTGAGTDTTLAFGIAVPASGGAVVVPGSAAGGLKVDLGADNDVTITGTVTITDDGAFNLAANDGVDIGDVTLNNGFAGVTGGGVEATALRVTLASDSTGLVSVDDNGGSLTVDQATASLFNAQVVGDVAHDAADAGNPVKIGGRATNAEITALANNDRSDLLTDLVGKLIVRPHAPPELTLNGVASATGTADTSVIAAQGAGIRIYVTSISIANSSATTGTIVEIKDGTTVIWRTIARAEGGSNITFDPPLRLTANTILNMAALTAATTVYFSAHGYSGA